MMRAINGETAKRGREAPRPVHDHTQWGTDFIGRAKVVKQVEEGPQIYLVDMSPNGSIPPHFHQVDQFQVLVAGGGSLGRNTVPLIALHYVDHHTAYGPVNSGPFGLTLYTVRPQSDPGAIYLHKPGYKDFLKPTKKRYLTAENVVLSTEPVLQSRSEIALDSVFGDADCGDGLGAFMLRMGAGMVTTGPDPRATGGQCYIVFNGSLELDATSYPVSSIVYADHTEAPLKLTAGPCGLEALLLSFPRRPS